MNKTESKFIIHFGVFLFSFLILLWSPNAYALSSFTTSEIGSNNIVNWAFILLSSSLFMIPVGLILLIIWQKGIIILQIILDILSLRLPYYTHQSSSNRSSQFRKISNHRSRSSSSSYGGYNAINSDSFGGGDSGGGGAGGDF